MFKKLKFIIYTKPFIMFAYYLAQIYCMTLRLRVMNEKMWMDMLKADKIILLCAWHQQFFSAIRYFRKYSKLNPCAMMSKNRDGDIIAYAAKQVGWHAARGSSSKHGKTAMEAMIKHLKTYRFGGHILDGPTGPIGKVKAGVIKMAQEANAFVVPLYFKPEKAWFFNSWDRFMLPKPFSKVTLTFGDAIQFEKNDDRKKFEAQRLHLETTMLPGLFLN